MLAHELRNPLAPVRNALYVMRLPSAGVAERAAARDIMERQLEHLTRLVDDLLDVSRVMQDRIELKREITALENIVDRAVETVQPMIDARHQMLSLNLPAGPIHVESDPVRLAQAISNLLVNAAKFTPARGKIALRLEAVGSELVVHVKDTGIGIEPEVLPHIFELFMQADRSLDRAQGGLGIGLNLVRKLVELHGGSVHAFSPGIGRGSEFVIHLPNLVVAKPADTTASGEAQVKAKVPSRRILVVDDNFDAAESTAMLLRVAGHVVKVAHDGLTALREADAFHPQIVLLDIGLPEIDGYEVARRLRQHPEHRLATLVAITGYGQAEDRQRSRDVGFDHHLTKPFDPEALEALISRV
jgi:CheY-like chemotaxis protein